MSARITSINHVKLKSTCCPLCGDQATHHHTPFCSKRCSQIDLGKWLSEAYFIPVDNSENELNLDSIMAKIDKDIPLT